MTAFRNLEAWCRAHPLVLDVPVALVTLLVALFLRPPNGAEHTFAPAGAGTTLIIGLGCLLLVARRPFPVIVWALEIVTAVVSAFAVGGASPALLPAMVGIYTLAVSRPPRFALPATLASAMVLTLAVVTAGPLPLFDPVTYAVLSWCGLAAALGTAVRSRRAALVAAEERAVQAEQGREEEAQRRVAEDRLRIARELHDVLAHHISVINVQAGVARHLMLSNPTAATESLNHVREASQLVLAEMPTILGLLRTDEKGLETAPAPGLAEVEQLVESMRRAGLEVKWRTTGRPVALPPSTDLTAYRLLQEALTNALKHGAGRAEMSIDYRKDAVTLTVRNPLASTVPSATAGHGLLGMRERVASVGGRLCVGGGEPGVFVVVAELRRRPVA